MKTPLLPLLALLSLHFTAAAKTPDGKPFALLLAGRPSHAPGEHEHNAGVQLLAKCLAQGAPGVVVKTHLGGAWPAAEELAQADTILLYSDGGRRHIALQENRLADLAREMKRGCGLVCLHYAVEPAFEKAGWPEPQTGADGQPAKPPIPPSRGTKGQGAAELLDWLGGYFEQFWSVNPHWTAHFKELPAHPISNGVKPFSAHDEWYFHLRFRAGMKGLTPILSDVPAAETLARGEGSHAGNPDVRRAVIDEKKPQHVAWAVEREDGGRGFGFTGGHFHKGWGQNDQRKLVLNAILWTAKVEVPAGGVESQITEADLAANLDPKPPRKPKPTPPVPAEKPASKNPDISLGLTAARAGMDKFQTAPGLAVSLWAAEPAVQNPTNIDIDPRGRVWVAEAVNYRSTVQPWGQLRAEGDRIVILSDTDGDGAADAEKVFWQSRELQAPLGLCVLPQERGTQVLVSAAPNVWLLTDADGDDRAEKAEILFKVKGVWDHDHQVHAFVFGADGKFYFNFGNQSQELQDADGKVLTDLAGHRMTTDGQPYRQGLVFRCDLLGGQPANLETLGWNFRNNYEVAVDSFGTMWQSDNDDDGSQGVRLNYVMEFGNYGFTDEKTGAGWRTKRTNLETEIPLQHWHQNDPGSVPNLLQTGSGSPTGLLVNEGAVLGARFENQLIHCDAGPRTVRAYSVENQGAGYRATMVDLLTSEDPWYRPADAAIAPDGSLFVADWYDAGVGGGHMADHDKGQIRGRIYRVTRSDLKTRAWLPDFDIKAECISALFSPNRATMYAAWQKLAKLGPQAESELADAWNPKNDVRPRLRARALSLLARLPNGIKYLREGLSDADSDLRITAIRLCTTLARTGQLDTTPLEEDRALMGKLLRDPHPQVRRQIALSLHGAKKIAPLWAALAQQHDGQDRWYLEALGIGAAGNEDECFDAWLAAVGEKWNTPAGRDILWRLRSAKSAGYLAKIIADKNVAAAEKPRCLRAFDFLPETPEKTRVLLELASLGDGANLIAAEALTRLKDVDASGNAGVKAALDKQLAASQGTPRFIEIVRDFRVKNRGAELLATALAHPHDPLANEALMLVLAEPDAAQILDAALAGPRADQVVTLLGTSSEWPIIHRLSRLALRANAPLPSRTAAIQALARTQTGAQTVVQMAKNNELPADLKSAATTALHLVQYPALHADIAALFPAPSALGGQPLPALAELAKLPGDLARGKAIAERAESSCVTCHRIGDKGADFGPALTEIGSKLPREALYDAILNPNAGVSLGFETTQLETKTGVVALGIVRSETNDEVVLGLPGGAINKFAKREIARREKLPASLMPSGLHQALTRENLVDLVEYLASLKKP